MQYLVEWKDSEEKIWVDRKDISNAKGAGRNKISYRRTARGKPSCSNTKKKILRVVKGIDHSEVNWGRYLLYGLDKSRKCMAVWLMV